MFDGNGNAINSIDEILESKSLFFFPESLSIPPISSASICRLAHTSAAMWILAERGDLPLQPSPGFPAISPLSLESRISGGAFPALLWATSAYSIDCSPSPSQSPDRFSSSSIFDKLPLACPLALAVKSLHLARHALQDPSAAGPVVGPRHPVSALRFYRFSARRRGNDSDRQLDVDRRGRGSSC